MFNTLQIWAFRDILRRPFESLLLAVTLTFAIATVGTLLLFPRAVYDTLTVVLKATPSIILRQVDPTGWRPLPIRESVQAATSVIGVVSVRPRIWGMVNGPDGPLTVMGVQQEGLPEILADPLTRLPAKGQAIVGWGIASHDPAGTLPLEGAIRQTYQVIHRLPEQTSMFTHDLVLLNPLDAQQLIGLPQGYASDLAIDVFHEDEQDAILSDLTAAFPWPVRCVTRRQSAGIYAGGFNRGRALGAITMIPAVLAMCLLVAVNTRKSMGRQSDLGIMKAMGWTTGDIIRLHLYRDLFVCLPSVALGSCLCFFLVYGPGADGLAGFFLGWDTLPPRLYLETKGAVTVLLEVAGVMVAPVMASALLPALKAATADVHELIEGAGRR
ncbi:FtsX-like permease family protein [Desulfobacula sp.]|uniref:ABC transporter permease n=1 Tax=Desulfobacula sp. TaxID=2593537 RepID=UPI00261ACE45|nr:FtsX-like permease family protein [Desulfobacula sp.]